MMSIHQRSTETEESESEGEALEALLTRLSQGDADALEGLYLGMKTPVYAYALSVLKCAQDAEDVLHDCFVQIYAAAPGYVSRGKAKAWIMTVAHNLCMQRLRQRQKFSDLPQEDWEASLEGAEGVPSADALTLRQCMGLLSDVERQILVLHAVSGFKHREIAAMLHIPLSTALSKYNRAIKKLKQSMNE